VDPGHGGSDRGVTHDNKQEKQFYLEYELNQKFRMAKAGYRDKMSRYDDTRPIYGERTHLVGSGDVFISVLFNS